MKFWQRFNKNTFRGIAAALVVAAAVMGGTDAALAAGEPVTEEQTKIISAVAAAGRWYSISYR